MSDTCLICGKEFDGDAHPNADNYHMSCLLKEQAQKEVERLETYLELEKRKR